MGICACPSLPWSARRGGRASLAASAGTALIVTRNDAIEHIDPCRPGSAWRRPVIPMGRTHDRITPPRFTNNRYSTARRRIFRPARTAFALDCLHRDHRTPVEARIAVQPAVGFPGRYAVLLPAPAHGWGQDLVGRKVFSVVNTHLLRCEHSVILWLVPSRPSASRRSRA